MTELNHSVSKVLRSGFLLTPLTLPSTVRMGLAKLSTVLMVLGEAVGFQIPLFSSNTQQVPVSVTGRDLISSTVLQGRIDPDNLLSRARELYHIAEAAVDEYGHPTRVIGSQGMFYS